MKLKTRNMIALFLMLGLLFSAGSHYLTVKGDGDGDQTDTNTDHTDTGDDHTSHAENQTETDHSGENQTDTERENHTDTEHTGNDHTDTEHTGDNGHEDDTTKNENDTKKEIEEKGKAFEREYKMEKKDKEFKIESEAKSGNTKDKIEVKFETNGKLEFDLKYYTKVDDNKTKLRFRFKIDKLIEYIENGTEPGYQPGEEVNVVSLKEIGWKPLAYTTDNTTEIVTAETVDGMFKLVVKYSPSLVQDRNFTLTPNALKIDIYVNNFPYTNNGSMLAIETKLKTVAKMEIKNQSFEEENGFSKDEKEVALQAGDFQGYFSWAEYAMADGKTVAVIPSKFIDASGEENDLDVGETASKMFFAFNATAPKSVYWDPKLGVVSVSAIEALSQILQGVNSNPSFTPISTWVMVVALLSVGLISRKLRKRK